MRLLAEAVLPPVPARLSVPPVPPPGITLETLLDLSTPCDERASWLAEWEWRVEFNERRDALLERLTRCAADPLEFGREYFPDVFSHPFSNFHRELMDCIFNLPEEEWYTETTDDDTGALVLRPKRGIVAAAPRGHAKSTLLTFLIPMYCAVFRIKRFTLILSDSDDQVRTFCAKLKREIEENELLRADFGEMCGMRYGMRWTGEDFTIAHAESDHRGVRRVVFEAVISGRSIHSRLRGLKAGAARPDLVLCHEKGTRIFVDDRWMNVEDHPSAREIERDGVAVRFRGLAEPEIVTPEHRYWARQYADTTVRRGKMPPTEGWVEAQHLTRHTYVGCPVDLTVVPVQAVPRYIPGAVIERDSSNGRIKGSSGVRMDVVPPEFRDVEWWWLFGLWWGDGHVTKHQVGLTIANKDVAVALRVTTLLKRYGIPYHTSPRKGCFQLVFCHTVLRNWLKTWKSGPSRKQPPLWVERIDFAFQKALVQGYIAADGWVDARKSSMGVRLTSIHYEGLHCVRRILARLGVVGTIRRGAGPRQERFPDGRISWTQQKYDLYFRDGAAQFGYPAVESSSRYKHKSTFISDGMLWTKVQEVTPSGTRTFVPIQTESHQYITFAGISHNCDDVENDRNVKTKEMRDALSNTFNSAVRPMLDPETGHLFFCGTMVHFDSLLARLMNPMMKDHYVQRLWRCILPPTKSVLDPKAKPLWPERFSIEHLRGERLAMGLAQFNREWMNDPRDPETQDYLPEWISWYHRGTHLRYDREKSTYEWHVPGSIDPRNGGPRWQRLHLYQAVDPSVGRNASSDFFAMITAGIAEETLDVVLLNLVYGRFNFAEQVNTIESQFLTFPMTISCAIETTQYQDVLKQTVLARQAKRMGVRKIPVAEVEFNKSVDGKIARLRRRAWDVQTGSVWFPCLEPGDTGYADAPFSEETLGGTLVRVHPRIYPLYQEMMEFPRGKNDDALDAFDMVMEIMGRKRLFADYAARQRQMDGEGYTALVGRRGAMVEPHIGPNGEATIRERRQRPERAARSGFRRTSRSGDE